MGNYSKVFGTFKGPPVEVSDKLVLTRWYDAYRGVRHRMSRL